VYVRIVLWLLLIFAALTAAVAVWRYVAPGAAAPGTGTSDPASAGPADAPPSAPSAEPVSPPASSSNENRDPFAEEAPELPPAASPDLGPGLHALVFVHPAAEQPVNYLLFLPKGYKAGDRWPVIFYLHGRSLSGDDPWMLTRYGPPRIVTRDPSFPFVVVAPQCRAEKRWTEVDALDALLSDVLGRFAVDPDRVYLTGFSMGAGGAWRLGGARPESFAAVAAIAGVADTGAARGLARVPVWAFHGVDDVEVPASESVAMVEAIRIAGGMARLELIPGRGHDVVDVYDRADLYAWFRSQRRRDRRERVQAYPR
jgi:predicted esterase